MTAAKTNSPEKTELLKLAAVRPRVPFLAAENERTLHGVCEVQGNPTLRRDFLLQDGVCFVVSMHGLN